MTQDEVVTHLKRLSRRFGVKPPKVRWSTRAKGAFYFNSGAIRIGPKSWRGTEMALIHEFAHHLTRHRHGDKIHHERQFSETLEQAARFFYGDARLYSWDSEYVCVRNYAKRAGLLAPDTPA